MVVYEGEGVRAPSPVIITLTPNELRIIGDEARRREKYRNYRGRSDAWGNGLIRGEMVEELGGDMPCAAFAIAVGLVGEYAVMLKLNKAFPSLNLSLDLAMRERGDRGVDLNPFGYALQVKTRRYDHGRSLVRAVDERGRAIALPWRASVFAEWTKATRQVRILGWASREDVQTWELAKGKGGQHVNRAAPDERLIPFGRLIAQIDAFRQIVAGGGR